MIVQRGDIVYCNPACARMFGHDRPADLIGTPAINVVHPEDRHDALRTGSAEMRSGAPRLLRYYRGMRRDGAELWYEPHRDDIRWNGRRAMMWMLNDVTEARVLRRQLESAQRMESIGRLAGGISHDFNNILSVITSYCELVLGQPTIDEHVREDIMVILAATERASALVRQLLAFSRSQVMKMEAIDLNDVVNGIQKMVLRLLGEDITLKIELDPGLQTVRADRSQLEQILLNLAVNARDAMPNGGTLTIETSPEHLDEDYTRHHYGTTPGPHALLAVSDNGVGMDEATEQRIFEPFFTTKAPGKGTGLGLSTVYGIVKQMGGSIWVYSEVGKGTTFKIYLPVHIDLPLAQADAPQAPQPALGGSETVLVVEDDPLVREAARRILQGVGYQVLLAGNGAEAMAVLDAERERVHLIVSDVVMPGMTALELLEATQRVASTPILFMSGYTDNSVVNHGILEGQHPFLSKPFTPQALLRKVRETLAGAALSR
jgi:PAS domain S-box-containing protein